MSLLLSVLTFVVILQQYWTNYGGEAAWHADQWSLLRALGVAVVVGIVVHRIVWFILNKFDDRFNHPAPLYTDMSPTRAYDSIRSRIKDSYDLETDDDLDTWVKEIDASRTVDLVDANPFLKSVETGGYESWRGVSGFRGLDNLGGPLGAIFRMMSSVTWFNGELSITLQMKVKIAGLDDNCTCIQVDFENRASPPVFNVWGPLERSARMREIKGVINSRSQPYSTGRKPTRYAEAIEDSEDYADEVEYGSQAIDSPQTEDEFNELWGLAKKNDPIAQWKLGNVFRDGLLLEQDFAKAAKCYRYAAEQGVGDAQYELHLLIRDGLGVPADKDAAYYWCEQAARNGNAEAMFALSGYLMDRIDNSREVEPAYELLLQASELGHADAQNNLARMLLQYDYLPRKEGKGPHYWYREAARRGSVVAQYNLAGLCLEGRDKETNNREAFRWYQKAAMGGDPESQAHVGQMYLYGRGVDQNLQRAIYWLEQVAPEDELANQDLNNAREELAKYPAL